MNDGWRGLVPLSASSFHPMRSVTLAVVLCAATMTLVWLGYQATATAKESARLLIERRTAERLALVWAGLTQDMKGAQATVLVPITPAQIALEPPYDLADAFARAFARFPYPEWFFTWRPLATSGGVSYVFTRADRPPPWGVPERLGGPYPVVVARDSSSIRDLVARAREKSRELRSVAVFHELIAGIQYQIVTHLLYDGAAPNRLAGLVGFAVRLDWVRRFYFDEVIAQLSRVRGQADDISLQILDSQRTVVTSTHPQSVEVRSAERQFPLAFVDRALLLTASNGHAAIENWTARVAVLRESALARTEDTGRTFMFISLAALATLAGMLVTVRGARVAAELASMKSDFVSSVTHELKTPLSVIRLIADTLIAGRYDSTKAVAEYATLLSQEVRNLARLIDNQLAYARLSDVRHAYTFEALDIADVIEDALEQFQPLLIEQQFSVTVDVAPGLPRVQADRTALMLALDNIIDNALKYSGRVRVLRIRAERRDQSVVTTIEDKGIGIPDDEIARVCEKFFRGHGARRRGSGLGLSIAQQIVKAHGGRLHIASTVGEGTVVEVVLPQGAPA